MMCVYKGKSDENTFISKREEERRPDAQFRFSDTGEGRREFRINLRHSQKAMTNHSKFSYLVQHSTASDSDKDWQLWTVEEAGSGYYFIRSKKDGKVIYDDPTLLSFDWGFRLEPIFTFQDACGEGRQKFRFERMDSI